VPSSLIDQISSSPLPSPPPSLSPSSPFLKSSLVAGDYTSCLVLEYVGGGELFEYVLKKGQLDETEAASFFYQILQAIQYCHANLVIHRDLKLENILLDETRKTAKINDFGLSKMVHPEDQYLRTCCGSPTYSPPEILRPFFRRERSLTVQELAELRYSGPQVDIWAAGVILFAMVTGCFPWSGDSQEEQLMHSINAEYDLPDYISSECGNLIRQMLNPDPEKRANISTLLESPWILTRNTPSPTPITPSHTPPIESMGDNKPVILFDHAMRDAQDDKKFEKKTKAEEYEFWSQQRYIFCLYQELIVLYVVFVYLRCRL